MYTITRQQPYWANMGRENGRTLYTVEIVYGDGDQSGADMFTPKYSYLGEGQTYLSAVEAFENAFKIREAWRIDMEMNDDVDIEIVGGGTMDGLFELNPDEEEMTDDQWMQIAKDRDEKAAKCAFCGDFLGKEKYGNDDTISQMEYPFCSQNCADCAYWETEVECGSCGDLVERRHVNDGGLCDECYGTDDDDDEEEEEDDAEG